MGRESWRAVVAKEQDRATLPAGLFVHCLRVWPRAPKLTRGGRFRIASWLLLMAVDILARPSTCPESRARPCPFSRAGQRVHTTRHHRASRLSFPRSTGDLRMHLRASV